jgi:hypothetical protein
MIEKVHCDLLALYGPDWENVPREKVLSFAEQVHGYPSLFGTEPELYGFVGTRRINEDVVAGYFAMQYSTEEFLYSRTKELNTQTRVPFARLFFVLFARTGKVLLQNSKFSGIPLSMTRALRLFKLSIDHILMSSGITKTFSIDFVPDEETNENFIREFERSTRVIKLEIRYPIGEQIPEDFVYYNPQKDRNSIIRKSHIHDYQHFKKVDIDATNDGDIKETHMRDLIYAGRPQFMRYFVDLEEFTLRKSTLRKFHTYVDMDAEIVPEEHALAAIEMLRRERAVDIPTPLPSPEIRTDQPSLFAYYESGEEGDDEDQPGN